MAEAVDIGVGDASTLADADNEMTEGISGEGLAFLGDEQWVVGAGVGARGFEPPTSWTRTVTSPGLTRDCMASCFRVTVRSLVDSSVQSTVVSFSSSSGT
jgi:hypothetical protein